MADSNKAESKQKKVLRRDFLTGSGAAIAAGALAVTATESAAAVLTPQAAKPAPATSMSRPPADSLIILTLSASRVAFASSSTCSFTNQWRSVRLA